jgi:hypothetical protein
MLFTVKKSYLGQKDGSPNKQNLLLLLLVILVLIILIPRNHFILLIL